MPHFQSGYDPNHRTLALCPDLIEQDLIRAYVCLLVIPPVAGRRTVTLGWLKAREVRLTELTEGEVPVDTPPFWLEVYCHASNALIDSCGCFEFDDQELEAAVAIIMEAGRHSDTPNRLH